MSDSNSKVQAIDVDIKSAGAILNNMGIPKGGFMSPMDMRKRVESLDELPPMPDTARQLLELSHDRRAGAIELGALVERDPALAAQVVRWARSPLYGYRGEIKSVADAIARVLGFDMVMNLALGLSVGNTLKVPEDGPLGLNSYWKHAIYTATLVAMLAREVDPAQRPDRGEAYLAGLLHNIGFLLIGHCFPDEFNYINRLVAANSDLPVTRVERFALGIDHCELGALLMKHWDMPESLQVVLVEHHNPYYRGEHETLVRLVSIADSLLANHDFGDVHDGGIAADLLQDLAFTGQDLEKILAEIEAEEPELDDLVRQLVG